MDQFQIVLFGGTSDSRGFCKHPALYRLATEMRRYGFRTQAIDGFQQLVNEPDAVIDQILGKYLGDHVKIVGFSTTFMVSEKNRQFFGIDAKLMRAFVERCKRFAPNAKIVYGGPQVVIPANKHFKYQLADYVIKGQGETCLLALANHLVYGDPVEVEMMDGVSWITDKTYPYNDFATASIKWEENDFVEWNEALPIEVARGCVFKCAFCSYALTGKKWGDMMRARDSLRDELIENYERFGITRYLITDDTINDSLEKVEALHEIFTSLPFQPIWCSYARLDLIWRYPQMAQLLYESGMRGVIFGIETMHDEAGKRVGKGLGAQRIMEALKHCRSVWGTKVQTSSGFILGLPGESVESMRKTHRWLMAEDCELDWASYYAFKINTMFGTNKVQDDAAKYGYRIRPNGDWDSDHFNWDSACLLRDSFRKRLTRAKKTIYQTTSAWRLFRMTNIGYGFDEMRTMDATSRDVRHEIASRADARYQLYFKRLLEWAGTGENDQVRRISPVLKAVEKSGQ